MLRLARLALLFFLLIPALPAKNGTPVATEKIWPAQGTLTLDIPPTWSVDGHSLGEVAYRFHGTPRSSANASLQITVVKIPADKPPLSEVSLKAALAETTKDFVSVSVEGKITPQPLKLAQGSGWFADITDAHLVGKPPVPGDYKVMRTAILALDPKTMVIASLWFDDPKSPETAELLGLLTSLHFEPDSSAPADGIQITQGTHTYEITLPASQVILTLPVGDLTPDAGAREGAARNPGYFMLSQSKPNLLLSGWFEPATNFTDIHAFWAKESQGLIRPGLPIPENIEFIDVGDWHVVAYDLTVSNLVQTNLRAELVRANTWIDLHLSATSGQPSAETRTRLLATIKTLSVRAKP